MPQKARENVHNREREGEGFVCVGEGGGGEDIVQ